MTFCVQNQIWYKLLTDNEISEQIHNLSYSGYKVQYCQLLSRCYQQFIPVIVSNGKKSASYEDRLILSGRLISSKDCESSSSLREEGSFSNSSSANSFTQDTLPRKPGKNRSSFCTEHRLMSPSVIMLFQLKSKQGH